MIMRVCSLIFLILLLPMTAAKALESSVDRTRLQENETLTLLVKHDGIVSGDRLDLSKLENDFEILSSHPSTSRNISTINGQVSDQSLTQWTILLLPKRIGQLEIPELNIGSQSSDVITIQVTKVDKQAQQNSPLSATLNLPEDNLYVGAPFMVQVEITYRPTVSNISASPFEIQGAEVQQLEQQNFQRVVAGQSQNIVRLSYWVTPTSSGQLQIPRIIFQGVDNPDGHAGGFFSRSTRSAKRVSATIDVRNLTILPEQQKESYKWMPAQSVIANSRWSSNEDIRVGEPITRVITISADGRKAEGIIPFVPELNTSGAEYSAYPDKPVFDNQITHNLYKGTLSQSVVIIPNQAGELHFPELLINWFDTKSAEWKQTKIEEEVIKVLPPLPGAQIEAPTPENTQALNRSGSRWYQQAMFWQWISLLLLLWCMISSYWLYKLSSRVSSTNREGERASNSDVPNLTELLALAKQQQWANLYQGLQLNISQSSLNKGGQTKDINQLSRETSNAELRDYLQCINRYLFASALSESEQQELGKKIASYNHKELIGGVLSLSSRDDTMKVKSQLPDLYPQ